MAFIFRINFEYSASFSNDKIVVSDDRVAD